MLRDHQFRPGPPVILKHPQLSQSPIYLHALTGGNEHGGTGWCRVCLSTGNLHIIADGWGFQTDGWKENLIQTTTFRCPIRSSSNVALLCLRSGDSLCPSGSGEIPCPKVFFAYRDRFGINKVAFMSLPHVYKTHQSYYISSNIITCIQKYIIHVYPTFHNFLSQSFP